VIQLKAVSCHRYVRARRCHDLTDHTTDHGGNSLSSRESGSRESG
jgi:hypothetical protein